MANFTPPDNHIHRICIELQHGKLSQAKYRQYIEEIRGIEKKYGVRASEIEYVRAPQWVAMQKKSKMKRMARRKRTRGA